jgi:two-component system, cell cycle sensor histidine kinase and response regulator CckA
VRPVLADPHQIEQVIVNLAVNASDAMPQGVELILETKQCYSDESYTSRHVDMHPGAYANLIMRDTGVGMSQEVQNKVFEPFFTTKEVGKGTGLGLSTVYGIINQSGGHIDLKSEPDAGATFCIFLPCVDTPIPAAGANPDWPVAPGGTETILVVEMLCEILSTKGYRVEMATNGLEAVEFCKRYEGALDLLIIDLVMPQMTGLQAAGLILKRHPNIKVLYLSGYTEGELLHNLPGKNQMIFMEKPFSQNTLSENVRALLDKPIIREEFG